jgi:hypothetical protein
MIRTTPPHGIARSWVCVYCDAHGPATSEAHSQQLTQAHLEACADRKRYIARIDRARKAMEATK